MNHSGSPLDQTERRIREGEERAVRLDAIVERLDNTGHGWAAAEARRVVADLRTALGRSRDQLLVERARPGRKRNPTPN